MRCSLHNGRAGKRYILSSFSLWNDTIALISPDSLSAPLRFNSHHLSSKEINFNGILAFFTSASTLHPPVLLPLLVTLISAFKQKSGLMQQHASRCGNVSVSPPLLGVYDSSWIFFFSFFFSCVLVWRLGARHTYTHPPLLSSPHPFLCENSCQIVFRWSNTWEGTAKTHLQ